MADYDYTWTATGEHVMRGEVESMACDLADEMSEPVEWFGITYWPSMALRYDDALLSEVTNAYINFMMESGDLIDYDGDLCSECNEPIGDGVAEENATDKCVGCYWEDFEDCAKCGDNGHIDGMYYDDLGQIVCYGCQ